MKRSNYFETKMVSGIWDTLSLSPINGIVSDYIFFNSSELSKPILGKRKFRSYMRVKLNTISNSVNRGEMTIHTEVVPIEGIDNQYSVIVTERRGFRELKSWINVSVNNEGKINRISIDPFYPEPPFITMETCGMIYPRMGSPDVLDVSSEIKIYPIENKF